MPYSRYQQKLKKQILKFSVIITLTGFLGFVLILFVYTSCFSSFRTMEYNRKLSESFQAIYGKYINYIRQPNTQELFEDYLEGKITTKYLSYCFNSFNLENEITSDMILCDKNGKIRYSSFDSNELNEHLAEFNSSICKNLYSQGKQDIYKTIYYFSGDYSKYVFSQCYYENNQPVGCVSIYLSGYDWNHQMRILQFDGIITDMKGNVIACSNRSMVDGLNRFTPTKKPLLTIDSQNYWMSEKTLDGYGVKIYTFVNHTASNSYYFIGCLAFSMILFFLLVLIRRFAGKIADINAVSVETLLSEINVIERGNPVHRIKMETKDEFEKIAVRINDMLDSISALSQRNLDLLKLNSVMEIKQLEAQFNPHFLYNTLESIRYSIHLNPDDADKIILKLTALLRRSISDAPREVILQDDLKYLTDYLDIIRYRFEGRFSYVINIDERCYPCCVPKLLLQPILENSIKYGFRQKAKLEIKITGWMEAGFLYLEIADDGQGMEESELAWLKSMLAMQTNKNGHKGLYNIARRLELQYGENSGIDIRSVYGQGTVVRLKIAERRLPREL